MQQMAGNADHRTQQRLDYLEEGRRLRVSQADEILKLETIKTNKLQGLYDLGIEKKYLSAIERQTININDRLRPSK